MLRYGHLSEPHKWRGAAPTSEATQSGLNSWSFHCRSGPAWGLNPDKDAIYLNGTPPMNDGEALYRLTSRSR
jgi:hypothetical protein